LLADRRNGAVLAAAAVPAAAGLTDGLFKHLVDRTYLGVLTYPSGHTASVFALAATVAVLLLPAPRPARPGNLRLMRGLLAGVACGLGIVVAIGVIGLRWHYFTDTVAGAAVGIGTVCGLAFLLDLPLVRQPMGRVRRRPSAAQPKASV
jgi:membrane-associated phospholipid phosphatase